MKGGSKIRLEFLEELKNNLDDTVETFLNEISIHFNNSKEEGVNEQDARLNELREEDCLYYIIDSDLEKVYLQNLNNNIKFEETEISPEIKREVFTDCILRYKNGEYIWDKELTDKFMNTLVSAGELSEIKEKFRKESKIEENASNTCYNVVSHGNEYTILSYDGTKTVKVPNVLMPFGVDNKKVYIYKNGKFELKI